MKTRRIAVWSLLISTALFGCGGSKSGTPASYVSGSPLVSPLPAEPVALSGSDRVTFQGSIAEPAANPEPSVPSGWREVFPNVRVDLEAKVVEFDAITSPLLMEDPQAPLMFLESIVCTPDTREHESLAVSRARPSNIHAAMLLIGLTPGAPGGWKLEDNRLVPFDPTGPRVAIEFRWTDPDGSTRIASPADWIRNVKSAGGLLEAGRAEDGRPAAGWVFAGSRLTQTRFARNGEPLDSPREVYDADESGTVIGLATFGGEMIAWSRTFSPDASTDEPVWIADFAPKRPRIPPPAPGTSITIRLMQER